MNNWIQNLQVIHFYMELCFLVFLFSLANGQECPGITKDFVNVIGTVGTDTSMVMEACQSQPLEYVAFSSSSKRIWTSEFPDQITGDYAVNYPANMTQKAPYEFIFIGSKMTRAGKYEASFLLGQTPPKTSAVFVAVNSMAIENTCPVENQTQIAGDEIVMVCEVDFKSDGIIYPKLTWENVDSNDTYQLGNDTHNGKVRSEAHFIASADTHNHIFTCTLRFDDDPDFSDSCTTFYNVQYSPRDTSIVDSEGGQVLEKIYPGEELTCISDSNPEVSEYNWTLTKENGTAENVGESESVTVQEDWLGDVTLECTVRNKLGKSGDTTGEDSVEVSFSVYTTTTAPTTSPTTTTTVRVKGTSELSTSSTSPTSRDTGLLAAVIILAVVCGALY